MNVKLDVTFYRDLCELVCGVGIIAFSIQFFILPNSLASNGLAGAGLIILSCGISGGSVLLTRIIESGGKHSFDRIHFILDTIVLSLSLISYLTFPKFLITLLSCFIFSKVARFTGQPDYREQIFSKLKKD